MVEILTSCTCLREPFEMTFTIITCSSEKKSVLTTEMQKKKASFNLLLRWLLIMVVNKLLLFLKELLKIAAYQTATLILKIAKQNSFDYRNILHCV